MRKSISKLWFFYLASVMIWLKSYVVQRLSFDLPIESTFQEMILLISPISSIALLLWLCLFLSKKRKNASIITISLLTSLILFANVVYHRFFNDFITLPVLFQTSNMGDLGESVFSLIQFSDIFIFLDFFILLAIVMVKKIPEVPFQRKHLKYIFAGAIVIFYINLGLAETVRPELLTRTFDREIMVKSIGTYNYHIYDIILNSKAKTQKAFANSSELADVEKYVETVVKVETPVADPVEKPEMFGVAKGKNVILVSLESTQSFVINNTVFGQEITPFLNDLIKDSFYFDNFYHQTGQGKTSDAEFIMDNSLYPLPRGAVYFTHSQNEYNSTPKILKPFGYYSAVFHANDKTFWNRDLMYDNLGYDHYFSKPDYTVTEENSIGWGLKDIEFLEQSVQLMKTVPQPFYGKVITLTNHHPFHLSDEDKLIPEYTSDDVTVNRYFTTVRYEDEAIKHFLAKLKEEGLYDNSIIIMYGDHYGISGNHNKAMSEFLGKEITPFEHIQLQRVPLIIHIPGVQGKVISKIAGQIDVRPTLLNLLGIEGKNELDFGHNLFADKEDPLTVLRDGSFITQNYVYTDNTCYLRADGLETDVQNCEPYLERADDDLDYSDKIIYGDLMRFNDKLKNPDLDLTNLYHHEYDFNPDNTGKAEEDEQSDLPQESEGSPQKDVPEDVQESIQREMFEKTRHETEIGSPGN